MRKITRKIYDYMNHNLDEFYAKLEEFVNLESYVHGDKRDLDKCLEYVKHLFESLNVAVSVSRRNDGGSILIGEWRNRTPDDLRVMLLGHYDTVYPSGTLQDKMPFKFVNNMLYGPGVMDMKGGIIAMYMAIKAMGELNVLPKKKVVLLINGDEESGSNISRDEILEEAKKCEAVLCLESAAPKTGAGSIKTCRSGRGVCTITVIGKSAHAGSNPHDAVSPISESAYLIREIEKLDERFDDATVTVAYIGGGQKNMAVIPERTELWLDIRFRTNRVMKEINTALNNLIPRNPHITYDIQCSIEKPPMTASPELVRKHEEICADMNIEELCLTVSGGSDGNYTSGAGVPTLDGLGMTGDSVHNVDEHIYCRDVATRLTLLTRLIQEI